VRRFGKGLAHLSSVSTSADLAWSMGARGPFVAASGAEDVFVDDCSTAPRR